MLLIYNLGKMSPVSKAAGAILNSVRVESIPAALNDGACPLLKRWGAK